MASNPGNEFAVSYNASNFSTSIHPDEHPGPPESNDIQTSRIPPSNHSSMQTDDSDFQDMSSSSRYDHQIYHRACHSNSSSPLVTEAHAQSVERVQSLSPFSDYSKALREYHLLQRGQAVRISQDILRDNPAIPLPYSQHFQEESAMPDLLDPSKALPSRQQGTSQTTSPYQSSHQTPKDSTDDIVHSADSQSAKDLTTNSPYQSVHTSAFIPMSTHDPPSSQQFHDGKHVTEQGICIHPSQSSNMLPPCQDQQFMAQSIGPNNPTYAISADDPYRSTDIVNQAAPFWTSSLQNSSKPDSSLPSTHPFSYSQSAPLQATGNSFTTGQELMQDPNIPGDQLFIELEEHDRMLDNTAEIGNSNIEASLKRKKSKMHLCLICHKQFPRPSGLKTHMNMHSNAKPYPCEFPGCPRTFGVRSNAKRHLRTHGVTPIPVQSSSEEPYIVGFSEPMIMPPPEHARATGSDTQQAHSEDDIEDDGGLGGNGRQAQGPSSRIHAFKVRWLAPKMEWSEKAPQISQDK